MEPPKLDLKGKKILYELDLNARRSNASIAKAVGLGKEVTTYRIKKLESAGLINGYYTLIDFSRIGYTSVRVYLKLINTSPEKEKEILNYLASDCPTFMVGKTDGPFEIAFGVRVKDVYEFERLYLDLKKRFKQHIGNDEISIMTKMYHFHRAYILDKKIDTSRPEYVGEEAIAPHDETDLSILKLLAANSRIPTIEVSSKLGIPPRTVAYRVKQLEKRGVIQGYRFNFDFGLLGYSHFKVDLVLNDVSRLNELQRFAHSHPNIMYMSQTIGGTDFEFDIEAHGKEHFLGIMDQIRTHFPEIREWRYYHLKKWHKILYF